MYWWYWQAYRTWVPYSAEIVQRLEHAFAGKKSLDVDVGGGRSVSLQGREEHRARQFVRADRGRYREVARLPLPSEPSAQNTAECLLRHVAFETLIWMDDTSGHPPRLTGSERCAGQIDWRYAQSSMARTIAEQLPPKDWLLPDGD